MTLEAHAKINLTLAVTGLLPGGYHALRSVVTQVPLADILTLEPAEEVSLVTDNPALGTGEDNLIIRAARLMQRVSGRSEGVRIHLEKRIPLGAGLGGGSADAATTLRALNDFWQVGIGIADLAALGAQIGSDVPALVYGGCVLMEGRGEIVTPLDRTHLREWGVSEFTAERMARDTELSTLVLETPGIFASTPAVYREFRLDDCGKCPNDLQLAACRLYPEIESALASLRARGLKDVQMSGSGSSVFGWL